MANAEGDSSRFDRKTSMSDLQIQESQLGETTVLKLIGSAGVANADQLQRHVNRLAAARPKMLVLDASALSFISSLAIGEIVMMAKTLRDMGHPVRMFGASPDVTKALMRTRVDTLVELFASQEDAMKDGPG